MSHLSFMEKLLDGVEVEWKTLGEVAIYRRGSFPQPYGEDKWYDGEGAMPFIQVVDVGDDMRLVKDTKNKISKLAQPQSVFVPAGTVIVTLQGSIGRVAITQYDCYVDRTLAIFEKYQIKINKKYFAYQLQAKFGIEKEKARGSTIKTITKEEFTKFQIPIPPLAIQAEIVRILDTFTALTTELTAELTAREKQYTYYRDQLLTFSEGEVEWKALGEMAEINDGTHQTPTYTTSGVPFVSVENIKNLYATKKYISIDDFEKYKHKPRKDDLFMTRIGDIGTCAVVENDEPLAFYVTLTLIRVNQAYILPKFLKYVIESSIGKSELYRRTLVYATPIKINLGEIGKIAIPIPPLAEQKRIVAILDKFETLTNSISEGLPREIELRQQQYEYYREQLLSFPKVAGEA